jgi:hypothetical protein
MRTRTVYITLGVIVALGVVFWLVYRDQIVRIG